MHVADFEAGTVAIETTRSKRGETTLVRQLGERIGLVHELRELRTAEEITHDGGESLRVDQLLRRHAFDVHVEQSHALLHQTLGAGKTHAALVGEKLTHRTDAAGAKVVDVIDDTVAFFQLEDVADGGEEILGNHDPLVGIHLDAELLVDLVTTDAGEVVFLRIEEETLEQRAGVGGGRWISGAELAIDVLECGFLVFRRVLAERLEKNFVLTTVDDFDVLVAERQKLADDADRERLVSLRDGQFTIENVLERNLVTELAFVHRLAQRKRFGRVEVADDVAVGRVAEHAQERGGEEFTTAAAAVKIDIEQVVGVELHFEPRSSVRNDAERMEQLAIQVLRGFEADTRRAVELGNDDALGAVDDESAAARHHRKLAHIDALLLGASLVFQLERHVKCRTETLAVAQRIERSDFRIFDVVGHEIEFDRFVVAFDGEHLAENRLETRICSLAGEHFLLKEFIVGPTLNLNEVRRLDDFFEFPEIETFSHGV